MYRGSAASGCNSGRPPWGRTSPVEEEDRDRDSNCKEAFAGAAGDKDPAVAVGRHLGHLYVCAVACQGGT